MGEVLEDEMRWLETSQGGISFVQGSPGTDTLKGCREMLLNSAQHLLTGDVDIDGVFKYGDAKGDEEFRELLSKFLTQEYGDGVSSSDLLVTAGATQGLHLVLSLLCDKSSPVFVEDPTYFYGFRLIMNDLQMNLVPVSNDNEGIDINLLDQLLTTQKSEVTIDDTSHRFWAAVYLIPVFSNPTGLTYSLDRCKQLVQLARKHDILLIVEDIYNLLYFSEIDHAPMRLFSLDSKLDPDYGRGHVVSNGTFSKILAPSLRLGWIEGSAQMIQALSESNLANSGGSFNHYTSKLVANILRTEDLHQHLQWLRATYRKRMEVLCEVLDTNLPKGCCYTKPKGGFFLWLTFEHGVDAFVFVRFSIKNYGIKFLPGACSSPVGSCGNCARLSISSLTEEDVREAAKKLCLAYIDFIATQQKK